MGNNLVFSFRFSVLSVKITVPRFGVGLKKKQVLRFIEKPPNPVTLYNNDL